MEFVNALKNSYRQNIIINNSSSNEKPLIDTSDWWHDGSWIIYGAVGLIVVISLVKSYG